MTFTERLWGDSEAMLGLTKTSRASLENLSKLYGSVRSMEQYQTKMMLRMTKQSKLGSREHPGSTAEHGFHKVLESLTNEANMLLEFDRSVQEKVIQPFEEKKAHLIAHNKRIMSDWSRFDKSLKEASSTLDKTRSRYESACRTLEDLERYEDAVRRDPAYSNVDEVASIRDLVISKRREVHQCSDAYIAAVKAMREKRLQSDRAMHASLQALERNELDRLRLEKECTELFLVLKVSRLRIIMAETESVLDRVKEMDPASDMELFMRRHASNTVPDPLPVYTEYGEEEEAAAPPADETDTSQEEKEIAVWFASLSSTAIKTGAMLEKVQSTAGRLAFARVLNQHRGQRSGELHSEEAYDAIASILVACLDQFRRSTEPKAQNLIVRRTSAPEERALAELFCGRIFMIIAQSLYKTEQGSRVYIKDAIQSHPVWTNIKFWEEMFFDAYCEEVKQGRVKTFERWFAEEEVKDVKRHNQNVLFGQLSSFAHSMVLYHVDTRAICDFVAHMAQLHDLPFETVNDILSLIPKQPNTSASTHQEMQE